MTLGELINKYLIEHDMSMRKFAALADLSHAYISNIVNEKTSRGNNPAPTMKAYRGIAKAMGMSVEELIYRVETGEIAWGKQNGLDTTNDAESCEEEYEESYKESVKLLMKLTPEEKKIVDAFVQGLIANR